MLKITIGNEFFDEKKNQFHFVEEKVVTFEHSLVALSKWESKFEKPFLSTEEKQEEELRYYLEAMCTSDNLTQQDILEMTQDHVNLIQDYIGSNQSATTFSETRQQKEQGRREVVTGELIYYWMVSYNIPLEAENWHLNRLFSLLRVCSLKQQKEQKMSTRATIAENRDLNRQRREAANSKG